MKRENNLWSFYVTNYKEYQHHGVSHEMLVSMLHYQWEQEFNGIGIQQDIDGAGQMHVFFKDGIAYVAYEDFEKRKWWCSYDLAACESPDWDELVRLTPDNTQDYSFRKCSLISKDCAWRILTDFLATGEIRGLYLPDATGKPVV